MDGSVNTEEDMTKAICNFQHMANLEVTCKLHFHFLTNQSLCDLNVADLKAADTIGNYSKQLSA